MRAETRSVQKLGGGITSKRQPQKWNTALH